MIPAFVNSRVHVTLRTATCLPSRRNALPIATGVAARGDDETVVSRFRTFRATSLRLFRDAVLRIRQRWQSVILRVFRLSGARGAEPVRRRPSSARSRETCG
jgi:hypothetical protein